MISFVGKLSSTAQFPPRRKGSPAENGGPTLPETHGRDPSLPSENGTSRSDSTGIMNARRGRVKLAGGSNRKLWRRVLERDGWRCQGCESASAAAIFLADTLSERRKRYVMCPISLSAVQL
jgi:hypothetical protein